MHTFCSNMHIMHKIVHNPRFCAYITQMQAIKGDFHC